MTTPKTAALLLVAAATLTAAPALAQAPTPVKAAKLPVTLKVDASALPALRLPPFQTALQQFDEAVAGVKAEAEAVKTARRALEEAENACASRTYSSQDMRDAGCSDTDTVGACTTKLYRQCMRTPSNRYRGHLRFFKRAVENLDQKALALGIPPETP